MILSFPSMAIAPSLRFETAHVTASHMEDAKPFRFEISIPCDLDFRAISITNAQCFSICSFSVSKSRGWSKTEYVIQPADATSFEKLFSQIPFRVVHAGELVDISVLNHSASVCMFGASIVAVPLERRS